MDHIDYVFTVGMEEAAVQDRLTDTDTGVLALASDNDAYAFPVAHHYEEGSLYVRLATDGSSTKMDYLEETDTACLTIYDVDSPTRSWSIVVTGALRTLSGLERQQFDETTVNESFLQLRVFDEEIEAVDLEIYELMADSIAGRKTVD